MQLNILCLISIALGLLLVLVGNTHPSGKKKTYLYLLPGCSLAALANPGFYLFIVDFYRCEQQVWPALPDPCWIVFRQSNLPIKNGSQFQIVLMWIVAPELLPSFFFCAPTFQRHDNLVFSTKKDIRILVYLHWFWIFRKQHYTYGCMYGSKEQRGSISAVASHTEN